MAWFGKGNEDGRFERVGPQHAWVTNRPLSRVLLFDLPRHADHHMHAGRHYSNLRHTEGAVRSSRPDILDSSSSLSCRLCSYPSYILSFAILKNHHGRRELKL